MTEVVAALIWDGDKFMACQRPAHKSRGLLWEFVGGKVEPDESKEDALIRECKEELQVTLSVDNEFMDVVHKYPDITVHLTLFNATIAEGTPQKIEHNDIRWITPSEIPNYDFCPADDEILAKIIAHEGDVPGASRVECGNYKNLSLDAAKEECKRYLAILSAKENDFTYPQ